MQMQTFVSGNDQFNLLSSDNAEDQPSSNNNNFQSIKWDSEGCLSIEDFIIEWDLILYCKFVKNIKTWLIKGMGGSGPKQIFPSKKLLQSSIGPSKSKAVIAQKTAYILDQESHKLYSVSLQQLFDDETIAVTDSDVVLNCAEVDFVHDDIHPESDSQSHTKPEIVDISSSGKDCFAIDTQGGIYKVPKLLCRIPSASFKSIHSGFSFNVVLSDTGAVYSWGNGSRGELGQRITTLESETPRRLDFFDDLPSIVISIACGGWHTLALTSDGDIYSWGWNESGQLGHAAEKLSSITSDPYPIDLGSGEDPVVSIAAGARHSFAVLKSGRLYSWGFNKFGQLAVGDTTNRLQPTEIHLKNQDDSSNSKRAVKIKLCCGRWVTLLQIC